MTDKVKPGSDSFKDTMSIVNVEGKRKWIYPKKPKGKFYIARTIVSIFLLGVLFAMPLIKIDGHPFVMFNIVSRQFILFGALFTTQDFYLFGLITISFIVLLILVTAVFGRVFCGWICPQTIFLEMVFRKIEYFIEGDYTKQKALNNAPWSSVKIFKKILKYSIFFILSFIIANTFLAYIIGADELFKIATAPPSEHLAGFIAILAFTGAFYFVFAWFREQACILVCPYGRLQSVLLNKDSIVIAYDFIRGEPRGKVKQKEEKNLGDCIDCKQCVYVCPTGIDIRNGTQLECVNCTACIDACDSIMDKVDRPRGLIRYDSLEGIKNKTGLKFTPRIIGYISVLIILVSTVTVLLANRKDVDVSILRTPGMLYQIQDENKVSNIYNVKIYNKTFKEININFKLNNPDNADGEVKITGGQINIKPAELSEGSILILIPKDKIKLSNTPVKIGVYSNDELIDEINSAFLGPVN